MRGLGLLPVAVSLVGASCASVPVKGGFTDVQQLLIDRVEQRVHWYQGTPDDTEVAERVASLLASDLTLDAAVQIALLNNRTLQSAYEDLGVAQADLVQAGLLSNPVFFGSARRATGVPVVNTEVEVVQSFLDLLLRPARTRIASLEFEETKLRVADTVLRLVADVKRAVYTLQGHLQVTNMLAVISRAAAAAAEFARRQHAAGTLSDLALASQESLAEEARIELMRAQATIVADRERLNRLLGVWGADTSWTVAGGLPDLPADEPTHAQLEAVAMTKRLDLAAARLEAEKLARALDLTVKWRWVAVADVGVSSERDADGARVSGPSLQVELPIFDQGQARIALVEALNRRAAQDVMALAVDIRSEVREARDHLIVQHRLARRYAQRVIPLRERVVAEALKHYNFMLLGVYPLLDAKRDEVDAYREYIETVRDYWLARTDLELAVGGLLPDDPTSEAATTSPMTSATPARPGGER